MYLNCQRFPKLVNDSEDPVKEWNRFSNLKLNAATNSTIGFLMSTM